MPEEPGYPSTMLPKWCASWNPRCSADFFRRQTGEALAACGCVLDEVRRPTSSPGISVRRLLWRTALRSRSEHPRRTNLVRAVREPLLHEPCVCESSVLAPPVRAHRYMYLPFYRMGAIVRPSMRSRISGSAMLERVGSLAIRSLNSRVARA